MTSREQPRPENTPKTVVIGTAGHIDHGKTALIRALTGVDTDRLPEEKTRGITIDLGFASLDLTISDDSSARVSFIDVPGHARFVRNMLAGAGGIDAVLLIISAEEGVKPQTEEHLAICSLLGIRCGITVLTKIDAVDAARLSEVQTSVQRFLEETFLASEPVIGVSAITGAGLERLRHELGLLAARVPQRSADYLVRLPIDRSFAVNGFGTVVTGTLIAGTVATGQELAVEPGGRGVKVRGVQVHGKQEMRAVAATRAALNLSHVDAAELHRGLTLVEPSGIAAVDAIDADITLLANASPLKHRARIHFHAFATECMATVSLYGYQPVEPGTKRFARFRLSHPVVLLPGDRFVLRQGSPVTTVGGGVVVDACPIPRLNKARTQAWLSQSMAADLQRQLALRVARRGPRGISVPELSNETGLKGEAIRALLAESLRSGELHSLAGGRLFSREALSGALAAVKQELEKTFRSSGGSGVKRAALKSKLTLPPEVVDWSIQQLAQANVFRVAGEELLPGDKEGGAASSGQRNLEAIERAYRQAGLLAPSPRLLADELAIDPAEMRRLVTVLLREKKLVRLGDDALCMHQDALTGLKERVRTLRGRNLDVALFKELTGVSRKYAIPLLEYLDQERVTRRQGDQRIVL